MYTDNLTIAILIWGVITAAIIIAISICDWCCINKALGRPCKK